MSTDFSTQNSGIINGAEPRTLPNVRAYDGWSGWPSSHTPRNSSSFGRTQHRASESSSEWRSLQIGPFNLFGSQSRLKVQSKGEQTGTIGNTTASATNIGDLSGKKTKYIWDDRLDSSNQQDTFKFSLTQSTSVKLLLSKLSGDADLLLLKSNGDRIAQSTRSGTSRERVNTTLSAGTYYIQVAPGSDVTANYRLKFQGKGASLDAGNNTSNALDTGLVNGAIRTYRGELGNGDDNDFYQIQVKEGTALSLSLRNLTGDADLQLLDNNGNEVGRSSNNGQSYEFIDQTLSAGNYFVRVSPYNASTKLKYTLDLSANYGSNSISPTPTPTPGTSSALNGGASISNATTISPTSSQTGQVTGKSQSAFYRFNVGQSGVFTGNLSGLTGDADLRLIQDSNGNGSVDSGEVLAWEWEWGGTSESIRKFLSAGNYVLQVLNYNPQTTNYTVSTNFAASATDNRKFSIQFNYGTGVSSAVQTALDKAAKTWQNVISYSSFNGPQTLQVDVVGESTTQEWLAAAKYTTGATDANGNWMPTAGIVRINTNYNSTFNSNPNYLEGILTHEFAHVLGIGTLWEKNGHSLIDRNSNTYKGDSYAGRAYGELKGSFIPTAVPVEAGVYGHWDENVFDDELLTPYAEGVTGKMKLSELTIASLRDLGWNVNYGAADSFTVSQAIKPASATSGSSLGNGYQAIKCMCSLCAVGRSDNPSQGLNLVGTSSLSDTIGV